MAGGTVVGATATRAKVTLGGITVSASVSGDFPISQSPTDTDSILTSNQIPLAPDGGPWTWAKLNALSNVHIEQDYAPASGEVFKLQIFDIWIEVYGPIGAPVIFPLTAVMNQAESIGGLAGPALLTARETGAVKLKTPAPQIKVP